MTKLSMAQQEVVDLLNEGWIVNVHDSPIMDKYIVHLERHECTDNSGWYRVTGRVWVHPSTFSVLVRKHIIDNIDGKWRITGRGQPTAKAKGRI